jgi:hypothetical protein
VALLRYAGPGPHDDGRGGLVRPGDVWDWPDDPPWGPWEPAEEAAVTDSAAPAGADTPAPTEGSESQGAASTAAGEEG